MVDFIDRIREEEEIAIVSMVEHILQAVAGLAERVVVLHLVEQNADASLSSADYVYVMHEGVIKAAASPAEIRQSDEIREAYLGI